MIRRSLIVPILLGLLTASCASLKDRDPFVTPVMVLSEDAFGVPTLEPNELLGSYSQGRVQIENTTGSNYYFVLDDLAIYQVVPLGETPIISIGEARDGKVYTFFLAKGDPEGEPKASGTLTIAFQKEDL